MKEKKMSLNELIREKVIKQRNSRKKKLIHIFMCESHTAILLCVILRGSKNKADGLPKKGPTYYSRPIISMLSYMQQSIQGVETVHYDRFTRFQAQLQLNQGNFARRNEFENTFSTGVVQKLRGQDVVGWWPKNVYFVHVQ